LSGIEMILSLPRSWTVVFSESSQHAVGRATH
jgi:hypothetical protein